MFRRGLPVNAKALGAVVIVASMLAISFAFVSHKGLPGRDYNYVSAAFHRVPPGLREGSEVRVRGQRVGQVHDISFAEGEPRVEMQLPGSLTVYADASVRIRSRSLLGQKYVQIDPGTAAGGALDGGVIAKDRTTTVVDIVDRVDTLDAPTRAALGSAVSELGSGAAGRGPDLNALLAAAPDLLADLNVTGRTLTADETRLAALLVTAERLSGRFTGREAELEALVGQLGDTLAAVATDDGRPLAESVKRLPATLDAVTPALRDLGSAAAALGPAMSDLGPTAAALGAVTPDLRAFFRESVPPLRKVPGVSELATPALSALTGTFTDARPLAPALRHTFESAAAQLEVLAPYAPELDLLLDGLAAAFSQGDANGKYLRVVVLLAAVNQAGNRNPYPAPGQAATDGSRFTP
jgi:phospholipid/cholesterol/gamma-HCH transport system substrate-binding protein